MPGNSIEKVVYNEWRAGFTSKLNTIGENTKEYTCMNMQVYDNGTLGVRPWLNVTFPFGAGTILPDSETLDDQSWCAWRPVSANTEGELWVYAVNGDVWVYDLNAAEWGAAPSGVDTQVVAADNRGAYWGARYDWDDDGANVGSAQHYVLPEDNWIFQGEAVIDSTNSVTAIVWTDSPSNSIVNFTYYRDRIWGWTFADAANTPANRLFYTDAGSYTLSSAGNYFDIGAASDGYYILGVWPLRDSLLICMSDGQWYVFTGTPDAGSLRYIGNYITPAHGSAGAVMENAVYFLSPSGRQVCIATPSGVDTKTLGHVRAWNSDMNWEVFHSYRGLGSDQEQAILLPVNRDKNDQWYDGLEYVNGAWTYSGYGRSSFSDTSADLGNLRDCALIDRGKGYAFLMADPDEPGYIPEFPDDTSATEVQLYTRDIVLNRPSRTGDKWSAKEEEVRAGSASARGAVRLASFSPQDQECRVRRVVVDFHYWKSSSYSTPEMACTVYDGGRIANASLDTFVGTNDTLYPEFSDLGYDDDEDKGLAARAVFRFDLDSFDITQQVEINDIMSIAIDRITVEYEVRPDNHYAGAA